MSSENPRHWNDWDTWNAQQELCDRAWEYLGPNLAVAGALCKAFWDGYGLAEQDLHGVCPQKTWEPGCNV